MSARRLHLTGAGLALVLLAAACSDTRQPTTAPDRPERPRIAANAPQPGTCYTVAQLHDLAIAAFGAGSPNVSSVIGKINNLQHQINQGNFAAAKERAYDIVEFVLAKNSESPLPGGAAAVVELVNGVFCFAGLAIEISDPGNSFLVYPSDESQILKSSNGLAGTSLPANPVSEPTLIEIEIIPNNFVTPGAGPLTTKLDQYPGFVKMHKSSETDAPFTQPVTVAVCVTTTVPASVRARLRLGHDASQGFEITPPASGNFLNCPTPVAQAGARGFFGRLARLVLPRELHARQDEFLFSGGVGGTAGEWSVFGPVDPEVSFSGGVGGTAGEWGRGTAMASGGGEAECSSVEAPIGSPLAANCRPFVTVKTALNTPLADVPVSWAVTEGGGQIAASSGGACVGTFGASAAATTAATGKTGVCWTLGAEGLNRVTATPFAGGDVPEGVTFAPATATFDATANPPVGLVFLQQPPLSVTAGAPFDVSVMVVDKNGSQVFGSSDQVTVTPNKNAFAGSVPSVSANAAAGIATFASLSITAAATGYTLSANSAVVTLPNLPAVSDEFTVTPDAASAMLIVQGNNQTGPAGSPLPVNPTVQVTDQYGNGVGGVSVVWTPGLSSAGSVSASPTTTAADGKTATTWTVGDGPNQLTAHLASAPSIMQLFDATGTNSLSVMNECALGNNGDPINQPGKTYAFYLPNPGKNKVIRQIQLALSSNGKANTPTPYQISLSTQIGTFDPAVSVPTPTTTTVFLRGNNSENKLTTFNLAQPIVGVAGQGPNIMVRLHVVTNPDNATISFNSGTCPPGATCKSVPRGCSVTEVSSLTPYPLGTTYRKTVGIVVKGTN